MTLALMLATLRRVPLLDLKRQWQTIREEALANVTDVLDYVQFRADELAGRMAGFLIHRVQDGTLTQEEADGFLSLYKEGLAGYTYLLKPTLE